MKTHSRNIGGRRRRSSVTEHPPHGGISNMVVFFIGHLIERRKYGTVFERPHGL